MKILHTSDWHIGRTLYRQKRYKEFDAFLSWLAETISREQVNILLIAGDIFDTTTPSNHAQTLYYRFLHRVAFSCRHVIITAGNHDSPSFINAPKALLQALNVQVIGAIHEDPADEVLLLRKEDGSPELIVCAVPYLRDRDVRLAEAGESMEERERKQNDGIRQHYAKVTDIAQQRREELKAEIPIIAMGHLFAAGGQTVDGDGVRALYIGTLMHVSAKIFPSALDYVALGHLHIPQKVGGSECIRYSGSPLPMGFGEAKQTKSVCLIEFIDNKASVNLLRVPIFQKLERIQGGWKKIADRIRALAITHTPVWLEIVYEDKEIIRDLRERLEVAIAGSEIEILRIKNNRIIDQARSQPYDDERLQDLDIDDVFQRCLIAHQVPTEQQPGLLHAYQEAITSLREEDTQAE